MKTVEIFYENGRSFVTQMNGTEKEIKDYYKNSFYNFGDTDRHPADDISKVTEIKIMDCYFL